jgi:hypothetical protein
MNSGKIAKYNHVFAACASRRCFNRIEGGNFVTTVLMRVGPSLIFSLQMSIR